MPRQRRHAALLLALLFVAGMATAQDNKQGRSPWRLGIGGIAMDQAYAGADIETKGFPVIAYFGERLRVFGPRASYLLVGNETFSLKADGQVRFTGYEPDDSPVLRGMQERDLTLDIGLTAMAEGDWGAVEFGILTDALDRHSGQEARVSYGYEMGDEGLTVTPFAGLRWMSGDLSDYYYGVRPDEATAARQAYEISSTISAFAGVSARYRLTSRWSVFGLLALQRLGDDLRASPIVEDDRSSMLLITLTRGL